MGNFKCVVGSPQRTGQQSGVGLANGWADRHNRHLFDGRSAVHAICNALIYGMRMVLLPSKDGSEGEITPFQALMTSLSATIGTGNIAGVAGAIAVGGPGAVFWMWIIAIFGIATKYAEAVLAVRVSRNRWSRQPRGRPDVLHPQWPWFPMELVGRPIRFVRNVGRLRHWQRCSGV